MRRMYIRGEIGERVKENTVEERKEYYRGRVNNIFRRDEKEKEEGEDEILEGEEQKD